MGVDPLTLLAIGSLTASAGSFATSRIAGEKAEDQAYADAQRLAELQNQPTLPMPDEQTIARERKRSIIGQMRRRGRQGTILTEAALDPLG